MMLPLTLSEQLLYTTIKLSTFKAGASTGSGTGFFWRIEHGDKFIVLTATNKHVINDCDRIEAFCHLANASEPETPSGKFAAVRIAVQPAEILMHPDPNVDLCLLGLSDLIDRTHSAGTPLFLRALSARDVPTSEQWAAFDAIENVMMIGCPRGIYDEANNLPIVRRGITATSLGKNYDSRAEFMVDMACFPGSSGSPIFINEIGYIDRKTNSYMMDARRLFFVGVLYAGPLITNKGEIKFGSIPTVEVAAMMHLGQVIRSDMMLAFDSLVKERLVA
jgi:hypothetical protein